MPKIGRNDPCPCGSGRKYKQCCNLDEKKNAILLRAVSRARKPEDVRRILNERPRIFKLEVSLESMGGRVESLSSRTLEIEGSDSLYDLHMEIQRAFGWDNDHMFSFFLSNILWDRENRYSGDAFGEHEPASFGDPSKAADETEIGDLSLEKGSVFKYLFDYGDEIVHSVKVLEILENDDPETVFPRLIQSRGDVPPQYG